MASIHRRPESKFWYAAWRDAKGRLKLRSTKLTNRAKARALALELERVEKKATAGELVEPQARKLLDEILERAGVAPMRNPPAENWLRDWLADKESAKRAPSTIDRYRKVVEEFLLSIGSRAKKPLRGVTSRDVAGFVAKRTASGCSPTTVRLDAKILRAAMKSALDEGIIETNPAADKGILPDADPVERSTFTPAEVGMLIDAAEGEWKTLVRLAYFTGARLTDCCRMVWSGERRNEKKKLAEGVNFTGETLTYWQHKNRKLIEIPLHSDLLAHLETLAGDSPEQNIMPHMAGMGPGGRHGLSEGFKRIVRKAGLDLMTVQGGGKRMISRRTFHALRHSFTSALANAGVAPEVRMKLTGHKSDTVHQGYTHTELQTLRNAVEKLPAICVGGVTK